MTKTRSNKEVWLVGPVKESLPISNLPSGLEVLQVFFHHHFELKKTIGESARTTTDELLIIWNRARIPTRARNHVVEQLKKYHAEWQGLLKSRSRESAVPKQQAFVEGAKELFDVAHQDAFQSMTSEEDKLFLLAQREKGRRGRMAGVDQSLARKEKRRVTKEVAVAEKETKEKATSAEAFLSVQLESSSSSNSQCSGESDSNFELAGAVACSPPKRKRGIRDRKMSMPVKKQAKLDTNFSISSPWEKDFRLPKATHPDHYDLYINPDLDKETFTGHVAITVTSAKARDFFLLHTKWLNITDTTVTQILEGNEKKIPVKDAFEYEPNEFWVISMDNIDPGKYKISMNFKGSLKNGIVGFYMSDYVNEKGEYRKLVTTKFEPTYARRAFPCFDEPSFKSTYTVTIVRPSQDYIALSNMPVLSEVADKPLKGKTEVTFRKSVNMVTYLVCFIVCDFTYKEKILPSKMPFRVYAPASRIENTQYALDAGVSILQYYEDMFDKAFPLPKSDMAAIPDYVSGATEHWGIITYRETSIFYNKNMSSATNKQRVASVVAHELAHQWFGNLVTLDWWDDLWLNEGFAAYIEFKGAAHFEPTWDMDAMFVINSLQVVMSVDAKLSSHPIIQDVSNSDQITAMFDAISYKKGSSVLRMLEDFMGEKAFQKGINNFINKYKYDNAITKDLWAELTQSWSESGATGQKTDVGVIMDTWTRQMGFPVLQVRRSSPNTFTVTQERFLQDPAAEYNPDESEYRYKWDIPVSYISSANLTEEKTWLYREMDKLELQTDSEVSWLKLNVKQKGFYRVNYESSMWKKLADVLLKNPQVFSPEDRAHLVNDALCLADSSHLNYGIALSITKGLLGEKHYVPWDAATVQLRTMEFLLLQTDTCQTFKEYVNSLVEPSFKRLGWENTGSHLDRLLRSNIVLLACGSGNEDCIKKATSYLSKWISDSSHQLPLGTKRQIYRWGVLGDSDGSWWNIMWERCMAEDSAAERDNLYYGLANSKDKATLLRYIELGKDGKNVRSQDFLHVLQYISANTEGMDLVWDWVRSNWDWLVDQYTLNDRYLGQLIPAITKYFTTAEKLKEMEDFFTKYPEAGAGEQYRKQALETVKFNINWVQTFVPAIKDWLEKENLK